MFGYVAPLYSIATLPVLSVSSQMLTDPLETSKLVDDKVGTSSASEVTSCDLSSELP